MATVDRRERVYISDELSERRAKFMEGLQRHEKIILFCIRTNLQEETLKELRLLFDQYGNLFCVKSFYDEEFLTAHQKIVDILQKFLREAVGNVKIRSNIEYVLQRI